MQSPSSHCTPTLMPRMRLARVVRATTHFAMLTASGCLLVGCVASDTPDTPATPDAPVTAAALPVSAVPAIAAPSGPRVLVQGVDVTDVGHDVGDPGAPITIVELSDFGCGFCAKHALESLPAMEREFVATGKVFYKHIPFVIGMFPNSDRAARAAECAAEQNLFWPMHDSVFVHQKDWKKGSDANALLTALAQKVVPDDAKWTACYTSGRTDVRTAAANAVAARLGVRATPTFFINGQMVEGALPLDVFRSGLNAMLASPQQP